MSIHTPSFTLLLRKYKEGEDLAAYFDELMRAIEDTLQKVRIDIAQGNSEHRISTTAPGTTDIEEGQVKFMDDTSSVRRLYTKLNGTVRYVNLT